MVDLTTVGAAAGGALGALSTLSKPANTLIEKVSEAVGGIAKPWHTVRVAKAEAKADLIKAQSKIEISEVERRALERLVREEGKKQENIESITAQAIPMLSAGSKPENLENDWIVHLFEKARLVSNEDMQSAWARILAGESNNPGSFSKRTLDLMSTFDLTDMKLFTAFCTFVWTGSSLMPLIFAHTEEPVYNESGINFATLSHLDNLGLITLNSVSGLRIMKNPKTVRLKYFGTPVDLGLPKETDNEIQVGYVMLTRAGHQLAPVCGSKPSSQFFLYAIGQLLENGIAVSMPIEARSTLGWSTS